MPAAPQYLELDSGQRLAYHASAGKTPGVLFLGGFMSNMNGTKAGALETWCQNQGHAFTRFDYQGHGQSSGRFEDGTIGGWLDDADAVLETITQGPQVVVGSSMGGWISLLLALRHPHRIQALITLACAIDFTERLLRPALKESQLLTLSQQGVIELPSHYDMEPCRIRQELLDDGARHQLLEQEIPLEIPVHLIHGMADTDVPWRTSLETLQQLRSVNINLTLIKKGDHRLSTPADLAIITQAISSMFSQISDSQITNRQ
jgi:pimeloyl-ACP methyl ester carboxylesterase